MILQFIFRIIEPKSRTNWFSRRFHRWQSSLQDERNRAFKLTHRAEGCTIFEVPGAGEIAISEWISITGGTAGFSLSTSWGSYGLLAGGVLGLNEARRMGEFLIAQCDKQTKTEEELYKEVHATMFD